MFLGGGGRSTAEYGRDRAIAAGGSESCLRPRRSLLLDVGLPLRWHRGLLVLALVLGAVLFAVAWVGR